MSRSRVAVLALFVLAACGETPAEPDQQPSPQDEEVPVELAPSLAQGPASKPVVAGPSEEAPTLPAICTETNGLGAGLDAAGRPCSGEDSPIGYDFLSPHIQLVVDRSRAMRGDRWDDMVELGLALDAVGERANLGLSLFPSAGSDSCSGEDTLELTMSRGVEAAEVIADVLVDEIPRGTRPLDAALHELIADEGLHCPNRRGVVVVVSSGSEGCGRNPAESVKALVTGRNAAEVHVVGYDVTDAGSHAALEAVAEAAAPTTPEGNYITAQTPQQVLSVLEDLTATCTIQLAEDVEPEALLVSLDGWDLAPCPEVGLCRDGYLHDPLYRTVTFQGADCDAITDGTCHDIRVDRVVLDEASG